MSKKQFSLSYYWNKMAENHVTEMSFTGDFTAWKQSALKKLHELLGEYPQKVDLAPDIEYSLPDGDIIRERVIFDSEEYMSVPCHVLYKKDMPKDKSNAAMICCNGHGPYGNDTVAGIVSDFGYQGDINQHNYDYGLQMAKAGYFVIVPELRGFGERKDGHNPFPGRDSCNVNFNIGALFGKYLLMQNIWDIKCTIDYLETRSEVNNSRIGMMGLSYGGTMTTFATAVEERIKAADIMCYVNPFKEFAVRNANFCGVQYVPEIYKYFDTHDIAGMIAPRPLLIEMGMFDKCFYIKDTIVGYNNVERIYKSAGASDKLYSDIFPKGHSFGGNVAFDFFARYL